jgi:hypothetical protein
MDFPDGVTELDIELWCYAHDQRPEGTGGRLTRFEHFQKAADILWNNPESSRRVVWNRWTNRMIRGMIEHQFVGLAGAGSSGKSDSAALFCLVEWLSAPTETMCLVCSSTLAGARGRIWKSVTEYWNALEAQWKRRGLVLPGKLVDSKGKIVGMDANGKYSEALGIWLIAAGKDDQGEADKKLKGLKAPAGGRMRLIADEFSDLGMCVYTAMVGNLATNDDFKGIGMANPGSKLTPFGRFVEPAEGWSSLSVGMEEWKTRYGVCLSFDALHSPRMIEPDGDIRYPWMQSQEDITRMKTAFGEDSVEYWAQVRGMFCPTGRERTVWSELELLEAVKGVREDEWDAGPRLMVAALDPAFTTGGDRSPLMWAECGKINGKRVMGNIRFRICSEVDESASSEAQLTVSEHVINQFRQLAADHGIPARRCGYDATGGGTVFGQWLQTKWSPAVVAVRFGEAPTERRASSTEAHLVFGNRVAQLWVQPKALVREGQIRGIPMEVVEELCQRQWDTRRNEGSKTYIESKKEMRKRTGKSPDLADTFAILVEVAIQNGLLEIEEIRKVDRSLNRQFRDLVMDGLGHGRHQSRKSLVAMPTAKRLKH